VISDPKAGPELSRLLKTREPYNQQEADSAQSARLEVRRALAVFFFLTLAQLMRDALGYSFG
jgi:hypothetical protein